MIDTAGTYLAPPKKKKKKGASYADMMPAAAQSAAGNVSPSLASLYGGNGELNIPGVLSYLDTSFNSARNANEARFGEAKGIADKSRTEALGYLDNYGASAKSDIDRNLQNDLGGIESDSINRGLYGTTILDTGRTLAKESAGRQRAAVDENANRLRADVSSRGYSDLINLIAGREDPYPQTGDYLGLIGQATSLRSEREARAAETKRLDEQRAQDEGKRIVHTERIGNNLVEYYADGTSKTFQLGQAGGSGGNVVGMGNTIRTGGMYF